MRNTSGRFSFLNRKEVIAFLRVMFGELRKLTLREGFTGVRSALEKATTELNSIEKTPEEDCTTETPTDKKT
jgi:hypothetical protein